MWWHAGVSNWGERPDYIRFSWGSSIKAPAILHQVLRKSISFVQTQLYFVESCVPCFIFFFLKVPQDSLYHFFSNHNITERRNSTLFFFIHQMAPFWKPALCGVIKGNNNSSRLATAPSTSPSDSAVRTRGRFQENLGLSRKLIRRFLAGGCKQRVKRAVFWRRTETLGLLVVRGWPTENHGWK